MHTSRKLTTAHAARVLGVSRQYLRHLVSTGALSPVERLSNNQMVFLPAVIERLRDARLPAPMGLGLDTVGKLKMAKAKIERLSLDNRKASGD